MLHNDGRQFIEQNIKELLELIDTKKALQMSLETDNDFMVLMSDLMGAVDWLFQSVCMFSKVNGLNRNQAIITGHLINIRKLYRGVRIHICEDQLELAMIFHRPIIETICYMVYMIKNESNPDTYESFVITSHIVDRELFFFLQEQSKKRELLSIEKRMLDSITESLKRDQVSESTLKNYKHNKVDGKTFKQILEDIDFNNDADGYNRGYNLYRNHSRLIHPNWQDMCSYSLIFKDGRYFPYADFSSVDLRCVGSITILCLGCLLTYIGLIKKWNESHLSTHDSDMRLLDDFKLAIECLHELILKLELAHEEKLG